MVETCIIPPPIMMQWYVEARQLRRVLLGTDLPILARASVGGNVLKMGKKSLFCDAMQRRYGQRRAMNVCGSITPYLVHVKEDWRNVAAPKMWWCFRTDCSPLC
jgi:hypothetical protein